MKEFPKPRSLTDVEVQEMRKAGKDIIFLSKEEKEAKGPAMLRAEVAEWMRDNVFHDELPESYPYGKLLRLADESFLMTYGKEEAEQAEIKN